MIKLLKMIYKFFWIILDQKTTTKVSKQKCNCKDERSALR